MTDGMDTNMEISKNGMEVGAKNPHPQRYESEFQVNSFDVQLEVEASMEHIASQRVG